MAISKYNTLKMNKGNKEFAVINKIKAFQNKKVFKIVYILHKSLLYYINNMATCEWHQ